MGTAIQRRKFRRFTSSSTGSPNLNMDGYYNFFLFTNTNTATVNWYLPNASDCKGKIFYIKNQNNVNSASKRLTLNQIESSGTHIWYKGALTSYILYPGDGIVVSSDGTYWNILKTYLGNFST